MFITYKIPDYELYLFVISTIRPVLYVGDAANCQSMAACINISSA